VEKEGELGGAGEGGEEVDQKKKAKTIAGSSARINMTLLVS
jgi:hypothetical protein